MKRPGSRGFTLLELLVSVGIMSALVAMTLPVYRDFQTRNDADIAQRTFLAATRRAQQLAQSGDGNRAWGVIYQTGTITIYRAANDGDTTTTFATKDATSSGSETLTVPGAVVPSGTTEFDFGRMDGKLTTPSAGGTLTLTGAIGAVRTVAVNPKGALTW